AGGGDEDDGLAEPVHGAAEGGLAGGGGEAENGGERPGEGVAAAVGADVEDDGEHPHPVGQPAEEGAAEEPRGVRPAQEDDVAAHRGPRIPLVIRITDPVIRTTSGGPRSSLFFLPDQ